MRDNGLSLFFLALFVGTVGAQSIAGQHAENADLAEHGAQAISWWSYVISPSFAGALMENWQSEFLQFSLFIGATIWLVQKGSNESSELDEIGTEDDRTQQIGRFTPIGGPGVARRNDIRTRIYENSLLLVMTLIFFVTWFGQSLNNWRVFNDERSSHELVPDRLGQLPRQCRLLGEDAPELAIRVPRRRHDGRVHDLPPPAGLARVEAGRGTARRDRLIRLDAPRCS